MGRGSFASLRMTMTPCSRVGRAVVEKVCPNWPPESLCVRGRWWFKIAPVPRRGFEPRPPHGEPILSRPRLPFRHPGSDEPGPSDSILACPATQRRPGGLSPSPRGGPVRLRAHPAHPGPLLRLQRRPLPRVPCHGGVPLPPERGLDLSLDAGSVPGLRHTAAQPLFAGHL